MEHQIPLDIAKSAEEVELEFSEQARNTLLQMKKGAGMSFGDIAKELQLRDLGAETPGQLKAKFRRGKFSYVFFMRMALAMNVIDASYTMDLRFRYEDGYEKGPKVRIRVQHATDEETKST